MAKSLKLNLVTDIHLGPDKGPKIGHRAGELLQGFVDFTRQDRPDLVVEMGDRISDIGTDHDGNAMAEVARILSGVEATLHHILGNHDLVNLTAEENAAILGYDLGHRSIDLNGWHLVFWQADVAGDAENTFQARRSDLAWLKEDLAASNLPTVLFSHVPLDGASMTTNYYFDANAPFATYNNLDQIQQILLDSPNLRLCVAGHVHWNGLARLGGIPCLTVQSLTESFASPGAASGAWATLALDQDVHWRTYGNDPIDMTVPLGGGNRRWMTPLASFAELRRAAQQAKKDDLKVGPHIRGLILDLDGVVYRGDKPIPGAATALDALRSAGLRLVAATNKSGQSADQCAAKLAEMGIAFEPADILTARQATIAYLRRRDPAGRVCAIGPADLAADLAAAGLQSSDPPDWVVLEYDAQVTAQTLSRAAAHLLNGARLIATNPDRLVPVAGGFEAETGSLMAFLEAASGQKAKVIGKPSQQLYELALARLDLPRAEVAAVGDTLATDIARATAAGIASILVESGNAAAGHGEITPSFVLPDITHLPAALRPPD